MNGYTDDDNNKYLSIDNLDHYDNNILPIYSTISIEMAENYNHNVYGQSPKGN